MGNWDLISFRPMRRAKSIVQKLACEPESNKILTGCFLPAWSVVMQTAVDNNIDLFVCNFNEHWLFLDESFLLDIWIIVWWRFAHVLQENLEGQCARSWPGRMQFRQSLFLIRIFFLSSGVIATNCGHSVSRCLPLHSWHILFPIWAWNVDLETFTGLIALR